MPRKKRPPATSAEVHEWRLTGWRVTNDGIEQLQEGWDKPVPAMAHSRSGLQDQYQEWVAMFQSEHGRFPNRSEDRAWAKRMGIPARRVAKLRKDNLPKSKVGRPRK